MSYVLPTSSFSAAGSHLRVDGLSFSYPGRRVLTDVSLIVAAGDRVGLIGENGSGKSILLQVIAGALEPSAGTVTANVPDAEAPRNGRIDSMLTGLGLGQLDRARQISTLSGGQRSRLALAWPLLSAPDVLLLDEPTNHFSLSLVTALEDALADYPGTVVIASHDRWLRRSWDHEQLALTGNVAYL